MAYKIIIDPGHGGGDPGAVYNGRQEKDDNLNLGLAVGEILKNRGFDVLYTRDSDVYQTPFEKASFANENNGDLFISFHRNSSPNNNEYSGIETLVYDKSGLKYQLAENIDAEVAKVGYRNLGVKERPGLVVLRRTRMPAVLIETGFLNNDRDNELYDEKFDQIAEAIANAVTDTLREDGIVPEESLDILENGQEPNPLYRVQVGAYRYRENADNLLYELQEKGYPAFILAQDGLYRVQVGAYAQLGNAIRMERNLRRAGYSTFITT
ncbi:MAG: N-acetylmuramoyl-L-alanine amidase [Lachnospiraceae bacterium]|nr:N-acetylmuramoyl-L-alanine amidase [Lachnospiraceae bacterium]MDD3615740.1 N-acetylmuramoyl-L-alanine amidase [Lachnospiraceae bacterium]